MPKRSSNGIVLPNGTYILDGTVAPEGVVTAPPGSKYHHTVTGGEFRKASGTGNTGWVELGSGAASGTVSYYNHITLSTNVAANNWASMPAAATEFGNTNRSRRRVLLTNAVDARLTIAVSTAGNTTAVIYVEYSTDQTTWVAMGLSQAVNVIGAFATAFVTVPVAARGDVWLRLAGSGGNGTLSPVFGAIGLGVRYAAPVN